MTRYATLLRRYQAVVADGVILFVLSIIVVMVVPALAPPPALMRWLFIGFLLLLLFYDPLFVASRGATPGHSFFGLAVADAATGGRVRPVKAVGRGLMEGVLGWLSLIFMLLTRRHQALHDLAFHTIVVVRDPSRSTSLDYVEERPAEPVAGMPGRGRRILITVVYLAGVFMLFSLSMLGAVSSPCLDASICTSTETLISDLMTYAWLGGTLLIIVAGMRGRLPGARAHR